MSHLLVESQGGGGKTVRIGWGKVLENLPGPGGGKVVRIPWGKNRGKSH